MLKKTHFVIGFFAAVFFLPHVVNKPVFVVVVLLASIFPEFDHVFTFLSKRGVVGAMQPGMGTRGIFHSFTFCILFSVILAFYFPVAAFGFFLGYGLHLLADSWTREGIMPFWPIQEVARGRVTDGGTLEEGIFFVFVILDVLFLFLLFV